MSARDGRTGLAGSEPLRQGPWVGPWLGAAASLALHAAPLLFPLQHLTRQVLPLKPSEVEVQLLHEPVAVPPSATVGSAAPALQAGVGEPTVAREGAAREAAATQPALRRREPARRVSVSPTASAPVQQPAAATEAVEQQQQQQPENLVPAEQSRLVAAALPESATGGVSTVAGSATGSGTALGGGAPGAGSGSGTALGGGAPGAGSGSAGVALSAADVRALRSRYAGQLRERVLARREYPRLARRAGLEGTVCLRISVDGAGRLAQVRPTCTAPAPLLEAALRAVREAAPFGPLPSALGKELVLDLPVVFRLDAG